MTRHQNAPESAYVITRNSQGIVLPSIQLPIIYDKQHTHNKLISCETKAMLQFIYCVQNVFDRKPYDKRIRERRTVQTVFCIVDCAKSGVGLIQYAYKKQQTNSNSPFNSSHYSMPSTITVSESQNADIISFMFLSQFT